ncbi:MAG: hypothetical protein JXA62_09695, partial [Candidatus Aminicenantes bacterium]|nr:hypothetical protein [Candidatus Aminicenantes bacterium]
MHDPNQKKAHRSATISIRRGEMAAHFSMSEAIECMAGAFSGLASGTNVVPERYVVDSPDGGLTFLMKPAFSTTPGTSGVKILSQRNTGPIRGLPTITGIVMLFDSRTGELLSMLDGEFITALRTGAAGGLATDLLARKESRNLAVFGCGAQGRTQVEAVCAVRQIEKIWIFDVSRERAEAFREEMVERITAEISIADDLSVLKEADIICTATNSTRPLFAREHIRPGTHINAIGSFKPQMQELDPELIQSSRIFLDDGRACISESGDLVKAIQLYGNLD